MRRLLWPVALGLVAASAAQAGSGSAGCGWRTVLDRPRAELTALAAVGDHDVWAVGVEGSQGLILHWDGHAWRVAERSGIVPLDVDAVSGRDIWVIGESLPGSLIEQSRSEHWDGVRWTAVPVPVRPPSYLRAVSARSAADAWAVGANEQGPLVVRWKGREWRPVPAAPSNGLLHAVDGPWAVGTRGESSAKSSEDPLVERLVGGRWRIVGTPRLDSVDENLLAVDAVSPGDVWAVGSEDALGGRSPLVQRLDGRVWRDESISGLPATRAALLGVAAFAADDVWVAGYQGFGGAQRTLLAHWTGKRWAQVPGRRGGFADLSALSSRDIWAVGSSGSGSFVERYSC